MNPYLAHLTDRELLEQIYMTLLQVFQKLDRIDDDNRQFGMNLAADLMGNMLDDFTTTNRKQNGTET